MFITEALELALGRISSLLVGLSESGKALQAVDLQYLDDLVKSLCFCSNHHQADGLIRLAHTDQLLCADVAVFPPAYVCRTATSHTNFVSSPISTWCLMLPAL